jgi:hypothetical protein
VSALQCVIHRGLLGPIHAILGLVTFVHDQFITFKVSLDAGQVERDLALGIGYPKISTTLNQEVHQIVVAKFDCIV